MQRRRLIKGGIGLLAVAAIGANTSAQVGPPASAVEAKFLRAVDGEKIKVLINGDREEVRFIGVDAPEPTKGDNNTECFALDARDYLDQLLVDQTVLLESDTEDKDGKDRLWRYVWATVNGEMVLLNEHVLAAGMGLAQEEEKNVKYAPRLLKAQEAAQSDRVGLWAVCASAHEEIPRHGSKEDPGEWGETLEADGVAVTLSEAWTTREINFSTPKGGYVFLIFQAYIQNVRNDDQKGYNAGRFEAHDMDTGADHKETFALLDQPLGNGDLSLGSYVYGQVCVSIQETARNLRIKYQVNGVGGPSLYWLVSI